MGYRSDIAITVYGNEEKCADVASFCGQLYDELSDDAKEDFKTLVNRSESNTDKKLFDDVTNEMFFYVEHVKWYEGYPVVDLFEQVVDYARNLELSVEVVRIGEDTDDVEENYFGEPESLDYRLSVTRSISW